MPDNVMVYFDNCATTQMDFRVLDAMTPFFIQNYANPNSPHHFGNKIGEYVVQARQKVAEMLGADKNEIVFTSGATEAINMVLKGVGELPGNKGNHIITVSTEHHAVLDTCKHLERKGFDVTYLSVNNLGVVNLNELQASLRDDTILVCVMYVNNETGVVQPIKDIASIVNASSNALLFTDATQAVGKLLIDVVDLGVDFLCFSGHKIHGPKGVGTLYIKNGITLPAYIHGGGQERGLRSGTMNVPGIIGLGAACEICSVEMDQTNSKVGLLRDKLETALLNIPGTFLNGCTEKRASHVSNIRFQGVDASVLIGKMKNIAVSNGSACSSATIEPSHVLTSMGLSAEDAFSAIRFSLSKFNTEEEVEIVIKAISKLYIS